MNPEIPPVPAVPQPMPTSAPVDPVEVAMAGLNELGSAPTRAHVGVFERMHVALTDALAAIDGV